MTSTALISYLCCCFKKQTKELEKKQPKKKDKSPSKTADVDNSNVDVFLRHTAIASFYALFLLYKKTKIDQEPPNVL